MNPNIELIFTDWAKGPGETEQERAENAEEQIRQAITASGKLANRDIYIFAQGSYRNRVNVRQDSDVDIGVLCRDVFFPDYPDDNVKAMLNFPPASYQYQTFKNEVEEALVSKFGRAAVTRSSKAFDIKANAQRVEADVAAFFEHRRYTSVSHYYSGVEMIPDNNKPPRIKNWPEQHYANGVLKNKTTLKKYKKVVRILKKLSNEMANQGIQSAKNTPSFLIECLVFNTSNQRFVYSTYTQTVREVLAELFSNTTSTEQCSEWGEVNELKYLFRDSQPWSTASANQFVRDAWNYLGYK